MKREKTTGMAHGPRWFLLNSLDLKKMFYVAHKVYFIIYLHQDN